MAKIQKDATIPKNQLQVVKVVTTEIRKTCKILTIIKSGKSNLKDNRKEWRLSKEGSS